MKVNPKDFKLQCIDAESNSYEVKWGPEVNNCTHVFYEFNPKTLGYMFTFEDEDEPEGKIFGYVDNIDVTEDRDEMNDHIERLMIKSLISYLIGKGRIELTFK